MQQQKSSACAPVGSPVLPCGHWSRVLSSPLRSPVGTCHALGSWPREMGSGVSTVDSHTCHRTHRCMPARPVLTVILGSRQCRCSQYCAADTDTGARGSTCKPKSDSRGLSELVRSPGSLSLFQPHLRGPVLEGCLGMAQGATLPTPFGPYLRSLMRAFRLKILGSFSDHSGKLCIPWGSSDWH